MSRTTTRYSFLSLVLICTFALTSCLDSTNSREPLGNIYERAEQVQDNESGENVLSNFLEYLDQIDPDTSLAKKQGITAVIPIDSTFTGEIKSKLDTISTSDLNQVIRYHFIDEVIDIRRIDESKAVESSQGDDLYFNIERGTQGSSVYVNGGRLIGQIRADNGLIYVVDKVLFQDRYLDATGLIGKRPKISIFDDGINGTDLEEMLSDPNKEFTIFAPTNKAFENAGREEISVDEAKSYIIPEKLISRNLNSQTYTTLNGEELSVEVDGTDITVNGSEVKTSDINGNNGVVHTIKTVLDDDSN